MPSIVYRNQEKERELTKPEDRARADKLAIVAAIDRYTSELKLQRENKEKENASATHFWNGQIRKVRWLSYATAAGTLIALLGVIALYASLSGSKLTTIQANRAWIVSTKAWVVPQNIANGPLYVVTAIANPSRTPAVDHIYKADIQATDGQFVGGKRIAEFLASNNICDGVHPVKDHSVVYPTNSSDEFTEQVEISPRTFPEPYGVLQKGAGGLMLRVCDAYTSFGEEHHTESCYLYYPHATNSGQLSPCDGGQHAD